MANSKKAWAVTLLCCFVAAAISAYVNLLIYRNYDGVLQPDLIIDLHVAAAFLGAGLLAGFILGSREAMNEPVPGTVWSLTYIARVGEYSQRVRGKSRFFSPKRTAQLLGFVLCLMCQFVFVAATAQPDGLNRDHGGPVGRALPA